VTDPLIYDSPPHVCWTRTNMAEAAPGILTPAGWSFYGKLIDINSRRGFAQLGVLPRAALPYPDNVGEHLIGAFHGRACLNVTVLRSMMSGLPGVRGDDVERDIVGSARPGIRDDGFGWRLPHVLTRAPFTLAGSGHAAAAVLNSTTAWWRHRFGPPGIVDGTDPRTALAEAARLFGDAIVAQSRNRLLYQGATSQLAALAERAAHPELTSLLLAGAGDIAERAVATDLAELANDRLPLETFLTRHGYHGPNAGDITAHSWREDPAPLLRLADTIKRGEHRPPRDPGAERGAAITTVLGALPATARPGARVVLRLGPAAARNLERSKTAFIMSIDGARAAIRTLGTTLVADGRLDSPDDAFLLFLDELLRPVPPTHLVPDRRAARERHLAVEISRTTWEGNPPIQEIAGAAPVGRRPDVLRGQAASAGVTEGIVRVVLDAGADTDIEPDDVLVCPVTDPSWVSLMTLAGALVIDIGSTASHGAIVARELGVPCVIGTTDGTTALRDGDRVRVDGGTGTVTVLRRADTG
jgi:pyruvate,water dikinase